MIPAVRNQIIDPVQIGQIVEFFISELDVSDNSREVYGRNLKAFLEWLKKESICQPEKRDIIDFKRNLEARNLSPLTINNYLSTIKLFFRLLAQHKVYPDIGADIKPLRRDQGFYKDALTIPQVFDLLNVIPTNTTLGLRDFALVNLVVRTGLRMIEVSRLDIGDIVQRDDFYVLHVQGKGRHAKNDVVVLTHNTSKPIFLYLAKLEKTGPQEPLFQSLSRNKLYQRMSTRSLSRIIKNRMKEADIVSQRLTAHSLRHTAITLALKGGASLQEAQMLGRHRNINTTLIYAHNIDRIINAAEFKIDELLERKLEDA